MKYDDIFVVCNKNACDDNHSLQLLSKAYELKQSKSIKVTAVCIGKADDIDFDKLCTCGADKVIICEYTDCDKFEAVEILDRIISKYEPEITLFPSNRFGKSAAAVLATRLESGLIADCIEININLQNEYEFSRAALNKSVIAKIQCINSRIQMCTINENVFQKLENCVKSNCDVEFFKVSKSVYSSLSSKVNLLEKVEKEDKPSNEWKNSKILFAIGRGVKDLKAVEKIIKIADRYSAEIVGTRAAVEEGLITKDRQIGQSGLSVSPNIYFAFGISGASQHLVGIKNSNVIIAINNDNEAPILDYADYVVQDDLNVIIDDMVKFVDLEQR